MRKARRGAVELDQLRGGQAGGKAHLRRGIARLQTGIVAVEPGGVGGGRSRIGAGGDVGGLHGTERELAGDQQAAVVEPGGRRVGRGTGGQPAAAAVAQPVTDGEAADLGIPERGARLPARIAGIGGFEAAGQQVRRRHRAHRRRPRCQALGNDRQVVIDAAVLIVGEAADRSGQPDPGECQQPGDDDDGQRTPAGLDFGYAEVEPRQKSVPARPQTTQRTLPVASICRGHAKRQAATC